MSTGISSVMFRARKKTAKSYFPFLLISIIALIGFTLPVFAQDAKVKGSGSAMSLNRPIVGMAVTKSGGGYWLVASDGGIFTFGDAQFYGSTGGQRLNQPIVGMAATATGNGYWLVASDGGIFTFGDAQFHGSTGGQRLNQPIVGMAATKSGNGYWLVASDGGIFTFGDAQFYGSTGGQRLIDPIVEMTRTPSGNGYWLVASDGGIFTFGDADFYGAVGGRCLGSNVVGISSNSSVSGYFMATENGQVRAFSGSETTNCETEYSRQSPCWQNSESQRVFIIISQQRMWACSGQMLVQTSPITTGKYDASGNSGTPTGEFGIYAKERNRYLVGPGYRAKVQYWMPFHRGYGMHDASWRRSFGGSDYGRVGSHGCVNMPTDQAERLYNWIKIGTRVSVSA